ncbi:cbb3-type cytochrome oxidase assembly protein CcoS [Thioflexithrix psekupsensis]|uniref:Cytochrome oxidase maturation protein, cbb3-type n=1 Tax=Thioflexithrix psekupsensis TaxID=1570016 RepID=A0A251X9Q7_9GAMM|nr:cbb3-type cytochrome oxidase assembly protein CcoS [Thioflexithrix psekupsensis]OUD14242.1 cytochrome oxidase maturation protein, cbb3-type [Thioflexithrix psekupsensis]
MDILYLLIPVSLVFIALIVWIFIWAIRSGQFDDLEGPAHEILMDDEENSHPKK